MDVGGDGTTKRSVRTAVLGVALAVTASAALASAQAIGAPTTGSAPDPTVATTLSGGGSSAQALTVVEGTPVSDTATVSGEELFRATDVVAYAIYADSACTQLVRQAGAASVSAGGVAASSEAVTLSSGTYYWQASYVDPDATGKEPSTSPCGSEVETVTATPKVELVAPPSISTQVGTPFAITATVTEGGAPRSGVVVTFTVFGSNPQTGSSATNAAGQATFSYAGGNAGVDRIVASFVDSAGQTVISNEVTKTWAAKEVLAFKHAPLPPPVLGKSVNVEPVSGVVLVKLPTGSQLTLGLAKGVGFSALGEPRQIPVGSTLDTSKGTARVITATASRGKLQTGEFTAGIFKILQARKQRGLTDLVIVDAIARTVCATVGKKAQTASTKHLSAKVLGLLKGNAHGKFTTKGQYSAATVRGTSWAVTNRCDGTLTVVRRGVVSVRDFARRKTITLHVGQSYLAKAP
jgi:hypothetical protein